MCTGPHAFIPVDRTVRVTAVFNANGEICENVYHVTCDSDVTSAILTDLAGLIRGWWHDHGRTMVTSACELTELRLVDLTAPDSFALDIGYTGEGGTAEGVSTPNNVAAVVKWGTDLAGASHRGRTYVVGLATTAIVQNRLTDDARAALATAYQALVTAVNAGAYHLSIVSLCHNKVWRATGQATYITALTAESVVRTQQRRLPGE